MGKPEVLQHTSGTGGGRVTYTGGMLPVQLPGESLLLFPLRRDMTKREMKSTIPPVLPRPTSDPQRV